MTFPTSRQGDSSERVAETIDGVLSQVVDQLQLFRTKVNAGSVTSTEAQAIYGLLTSARVYVEANKNVSGLSEAYVRRFPGSAGFNPDAEWTAVRVRLDALISWFVANLPKDGSGRPVFQQFRAVTQELEIFNITLAAQVRTTLLELIDALLATFD